LQKKRHSVDNVDEDTLIEIAIEAFVKELGLDDDIMLKGKLEIREVAAGTHHQSQTLHENRPAFEERFLRVGPTPPTTVPTLIFHL
jgi:hypothetical protein